MSITNPEIKMNTSRQSEEIITPPFSPSFESGGMIYISGQIGLDPLTGKLVNNSFEAEADQVMKNLGLILSGHQLTYHHLVNVTIYLTTMEHYEATNKIYRKYFNKIFPARVCIAVNDLPMRANIEIAAIANPKPDESKTKIIS